MNNYKTVIPIVLFGIILFMVLNLGYAEKRVTQEITPTPNPKQIEEISYQTLADKEIEQVKRADFIKERVKQKTILTEEEREIKQQKELERIAQSKAEAELKVQAYLSSKQKEIVEEVKEEVIEIGEVVESVTPISSKSRDDKPLQVDTSRGGSREYVEFGISAYDLSFNSVETEEGDPWHGITSAGIDLKGKTWEQARIVATDPKVIPTGSVIEMKFITPGYQRFDGQYLAGDVGGAIKGNRIDVFKGDFGSRETDQSVWDFGRPKALVRIVSTP